MIQRSLSDKVMQVLIHFILLAFGLTCVYPFILTFMASISSEKSILDYGYQLIPKEFSLLAYELVFKDEFIYSGYTVSIFVTVAGTAMSLLICGMAGYAMSIKRVKYRNAVAIYFYLTMVFGAGLLPWYLVCTQFLHLQNTVLALILPGLVSPFNVFLMRNYFASIPSELIESAEIDGCGVMRTFVQIIIPLSLPIMATITLFIGLAYWNDWASALWFIDNPDLYPLQYMLFRIESLMSFVKQYGSMGDMTMPTETFQVATLFVTIGPIIFLYPFIQRYFVKGIMIGAVKG
ncbi:carbohydrate ABC transporter permease [Paenibacillus montanisoli]|uniref:Carbohydrate ABC transporter permease n=1 Tax=Paenibacillus montanisoli TaxID=2081970 RepID=A0A328U5H7_9BACL|nr:carbohydrate ABC transporter permease [Paenibacillus montanisoli]RAP75166.1 carbohydrate ABC transporter permease [Paenibacillus montanisoli]